MYHLSEPLHNHCNPSWIHSSNSFLWQTLFEVLEDTKMKRPDHILVGRYKCKKKKQQTTQTQLQAAKWCNMGWLVKEPQGLWGRQGGCPEEVTVKQRCEGCFPCPWWRRRGECSKHIVHTGCVLQGHLQFQSGCMFLPLV